jgi:hypothetical protein
MTQLKEEQSALEANRSAHAARTDGLQAELLVCEAEMWAAQAERCEFEFLICMLTGP